MTNHRESNGSGSGPDDMPETVKLINKLSNFILAVIITVTLCVGIVIYYVCSNQAAACEAKGGELVGTSSTCLKKEVVIHL